MFKTFIPHRTDGMIRSSFNIGCSESKVIFKWLKNNKNDIKKKTKKKASQTSTRSKRSHLVDFTNKHSQHGQSSHSPPWPCDKGCGEACAERFSALNFEHDGRYFVSRPSPHKANYPSWLRAQNHVHLSQLFVRKQVRWTPIFLQVFAKNSLIKNVSKEPKKLIVEHDFFWKIVSYLVYLCQGEDFKLTTELSEKSAISSQQGNQKWIKWSNTAYLNKRCSRKTFVCFK